MLKYANFHLPRSLKSQSACSCKIWSSSVERLRCYCKFSISNMAAVRHLGFFVRGTTGEAALSAGVKLGRIPPDLSSPTSAFRSATCNLGSTTLKYRSGTFLMGSTNVKHGILTVRWIQCQCSTDDEYIKWTAGRDHLAVACASGHYKVIFSVLRFCGMIGLL